MGTTTCSSTSPPVTRSGLVDNAVSMTAPPALAARTATPRYASAIPRTARAVTTTTGSFFMRAILHGMEERREVFFRSAVSVPTAVLLQLVEDDAAERGRPLQIGPGVQSAQRSVRQLLAVHEQVGDTQ